jgi:hypothetical protein
MRTIGPLLACSILVWSSCSKNDSTASTPGATDALWAMAPASADVGVVIAPGTGESLLAAWLAVENSLARQPAGSRILDAIRQELPPEVLDLQAHARFGLGLGLGAAVFVTPDDQAVMILPIANREAFRNALDGKTEDQNGTTVDLVDDMRCKMIKDLYACAPSDELLAQMGTSDTLARAVAARPAHLRGHVEVHVDSRRLAENDDVPLASYFHEPGALQAALTLERGVVTARAFLPARPGSPLISAFTRVPDDLARSAVADKKPAGMWRLRVPLNELIPREQATAELATVASAVAGFDPARDLLDNLTGEMIAYSLPSQEINAAIEIGLHEGKRLQPLLTTACSLARLADLPVEITMKDERCVATLDLARLKTLDPSLAAMPLDMTLTVSLSATDKALVLHLGTPTGPAPNVELEPLARSLMTEKWNWAGWSRITFAGGFDGSLFEPLKQHPEGHQAVMLTLWLFGHINEMGSGVAVRDDGVHAILHLSTQWANPDHVLQEFEKHLADMLAGDTTAAARLDALAEKSPDTPLGQAYKAGPGNLFTSFTGVGVMVMLALLGDQQQDHEPEMIAPEDE